MALQPYSFSQMLLKSSGRHLFYLLQALPSKRYIKYIHGQNKWVLVNLNTEKYRRTINIATSLEAYRTLWARNKLLAIAFKPWIQQLQFFLSSTALDAQSGVNSLKQPSSIKIEDSYSCFHALDRDNVIKATFQSERGIQVNKDGFEDWMQQLNFSVPTTALDAQSNVNSLGSCSSKRLKMISCRST